MPHFHSSLSHFVSNIHSCSIFLLKEKLLPSAVFPASTFILVALLEAVHAIYLFVQTGLFASVHCTMSYWSPSTPLALVNHQNWILTDILLQYPVLAIVVDIVQQWFGGLIPSNISRDHRWDICLGMPSPRPVYVSGYSSVGLFRPLEPFFSCEGLFQSYGGGGSSFFK